MKVLSPERQELIEALVAEAAPSGITAGLLEKDEHLTDALRALFALRIQGVQLVLCGGTSLSKSYGLIERMSEDADLKVALSDTGQPSRTEIRRRLSSLRSQTTETLASIGLVEEKSQGQAFNENRYFCSGWAYARRYASAAGFRPHLQIELTARAPVLPTQIRRITSLADQLAGRNSHAFEVPVVAVAETLTEKTLSFLRRYAQHRAGLLRQPWDKALVRHLYDVHRIFRADTEVLVDARRAFPALVTGDQKEFGAQFPDFAQAPRKVLNGAVRQARADARIKEEFHDNLLPLVYANTTAAFAQVFLDFQTVSESLLDTLP